MTTTIFAVLTAVVVLTLAVCQRIVDEAVPEQQRLGLKLLAAASAGLVMLMVLHTLLRSLP